MNPDLSTTGSFLLKIRKRALFCHLQVQWTDLYLVPRGRRRQLGDPLPLVSDPSVFSLNSRGRVEGFFSLGEEQVRAVPAGAFLPQTQGLAPLP